MTEDDFDINMQKICHYKKSLTIEEDDGAIHRIHFN